MRNTKDILVENSLRMMRDNLSHTFFAVTMRPYESFLRKFPYSTRTTITELILTNIISKYDAHLISHPNKPKNHHLKIISHNGIETKTRFGSPDIPHSHGIWGIHKSLIQKWDSPSFQNRILDKGFFIYEDQKFPLRKVIHSIKRDFITEDKEWLDYAYKWSDDDDPLTEWSFIHSPDNQQQKTKKEMWDEPHSTITGVHRGLRREDPLPQRTLPTPVRTSQTGTHQGTRHHI